MPNSLNKLPFPTLKRVAQQTASHCGPACLQMLASYLNYDIHQNQIVQAAQVSHKLSTHGTLISDLAKAAEILLPDCQFWFKYNSTIADLSALVNTYEYPVAVEWQGIFDWPDVEDEDDNEIDDYGPGDDDPGHYSVVTHIDTQTNVVLVADPERHYAGTDRHFSILQFDRRWWDINEVTDPQTGHRQETDDYHAMFILTPKDTSFPQQLHMTPALAVTD